MARFVTAGGGSGGGGVDVPSAAWAEDGSADDRIGSILVAEPENTQVDDALAYVLVKEGEDVQSNDGWSQFIASANAEDAQANDLTKLQLLSVDVARTGTPDSDLMFDAYTNQLAAFAGTNFGNATLQCRGVTTVSPGSDEQRAYIAIDLTGFAGCTADPVSPLTIDIQVANSNLLTATTLTVTGRITATKPFTESTVTWNAPPTLGTSVGVVAGLSVAAGGAFQAKTISPTQAQTNQILGNWLLLVFTGPSAATTVLVDTFTIKSRDDATASNRPKFSLNVQRGT